MPPRGNHDQPHAPCVDNLQHRYSPRLTAAFFGCHRAPPQGFTLRIYVSNKRRTGNGGCLCVRLGDVWDVGRGRRCWRGGGVRGGERDERRRKREKRGPGRSPGKILKTRFYPVSRPRGAFSFAFWDSSHRDLPLRAIAAQSDAWKQRSRRAPQNTGRNPMAAFFTNVNP